ncbi:MAG: flavodoxin-dependent (E)-4-hydroxy-3-methylbut-2-enyl-diphosphate synthase [Kiritimatiellaeota bacterium]|nr:flavodoxin-dependent (E)-4-hydroxy-3-methylbut-2-enyl-diphosphate synthase [Kiritimatiellota bacterium]
MLSQQTDWPLHLGVTEAGTFLAGTVRSSVAIGILLAEGIGDTIRVSLTDTPLNEVKVGLEIVRSLGLRPPGIHVTACPTCGRTKVDVIGTAQAVEGALERFYRERPDAPRRHIAVMGCVVNGPGEAREADIALIGKTDSFDLLLHGNRVSTVAVSAAPAAVLGLVAASFVHSVAGELVRG